MSTRRRVPGEGAIYHRADGRWAASVTIGYGPRVREPRPGVEHPLDATRKRVTLYGANRGEVERKLQDLRRHLAAGLPVVDERTTVADYLAGWLERVAPRLRPATRLRYAGLVKHQISPHLGHLRLARLQPADVAKMLADVQAQGLSPRTAAHCRAVLRAALSDAERWGLVVRNVAKLTDPPSVPSPTPKMLPVEDVHRVLDAVRGTEVDNPVTVALYSGMRLGEVLGLGWAEVDFETGQVTVARALQRLGGVSRLVEPKSASSRRTLQLPGPALDALRGERRRQVAAHLAAGSRWRPSIAGLVFTDALGAPMDGTKVTARFQRCLAVAGLPRLRFHHLRHLHAGLMLGSGADIATVSHLLGHSSVALTVSTYAAIMPALKREAAERFERLLSRPG